MSSAAVRLVYAVVWIVNRCSVGYCHCVSFDGEARVLYVSDCTVIGEQGVDVSGWVREEKQPVRYSVWEEKYRNGESKMERERTKEWGESVLRHLPWKRSHVMSQVIVFPVLKSHYHKWRGRQQWGAILRPTSMKAMMAKVKVRLLSAWEIQSQALPYYSSSYSCWMDYCNMQRNPDIWYNCSSKHL